jgi:uncharacterized membrane protein
LRHLAVDWQAAYSDSRFMSNTRLPSSIFFSLALLGGVQYFYYAPRLPEMLASHFGVTGAVNGWQSKTAFSSIELMIILVATIVAFGIPRIIEAMPVSVINLPHKEFWLSPERREASYAYIRSWNAWFGCALLAFLLFVMELAFRANLQTPPKFNMAAFFPALFAFVAFDTVALLRLILHFSRIQGDRLGP